MFIIRIILVFSFLLPSFYCSNILDDLAPDGRDLRDGSSANYPGKLGAIVPATSFKYCDSTNGQLSDFIPAKSGVVFYFTMWCSVCYAHTSHIVNTLKPAYPNVEFIVVDFVSGTVGSCSSSVSANGLTGKLPVVADTDLSLFDYFGGTMSKTVLVNAGGMVIFNEDFKDASRLTDALNALP